MLAEDAEEVVGMLVSDVFDAKIVDDQDKLDGAPDVLTEARCGSRFMVLRRSESLAEEVVGESSGLGQSIGASDYSKVHPAMVYQGQIWR